MRIPLLPRELHTTERPSSTAQWTAVGRALELDRAPQQRIVTDEYAPLFLTATSRAFLAAFRAAGPAVRLAERQQFVGLSGFALCRHRFIDEHLLQWCDETDGTGEQVVILGAGYDTRAYRLTAALAGRPVFEVDLPPISRRKAAIVAARPQLFGHAHVRRVEINFRTESLAERLGAAGLAGGSRTFVAWEGVSPYLTTDAVEATLETLAELCGAGSVLAMDFWDGVGGGGLLGPVRWAAAQAFALVGEPMHFGIRPERVGGFLAGHGWEVSDLARDDQLARRYATGGRPSERSTYLVAADRG
jgi:methyltransferase (TIGR00027 family)